MGNTPNIRFKGFDEDWEQRKLGDLTTYRNGTGHEEKQSDVGKYELVNLNSISIDGGLKPSGKFIDEETETLIKDDLVMVLSDVGHGDLLGRVAIIPENNRFVLNQRVALLRNNGFADTKYLFSYINAHQRYFKLQGAGSSQLNISRGSVENFEVLLPKRDEQKQIGECFSNLDHLITLHQRKCQETKKLKEYMLQKMFPPKGEKIPEIRFAGFTGDWEQRKLGEVAKIISGGTPSTKIDEYWDGDIDWYAPAEIGEQIYLNSSQRKITRLGLEKSSAKMLPIGTVLFTSRAGIGKSAILLREGCTNQGFQSIVPKKEKLDSYFIFTRSEELKRYGETVGAGSTFVEVSGKQMANMNLMMPKTILEQQVIGKCFCKIDHLITLHQCKVRELTELKNYMLQNMFPKKGGKKCQN